MLSESTRPNLVTSDDFRHLGFDPPSLNMPMPTFNAKICEYVHSARLQLPARSSYLDSLMSKTNGITTSVSFSQVVALYFTRSGSIRLSCGWTLLVQQDIIGQKTNI